MMKTLLGKRGRAALFAMGASAGAIIVLLVYALTTTAVNSSETNERSESRESQVAANDQTLEIIKDCTDTNGVCFRANQKRLARAVRDIGAGNILAVACALQVPNGTGLQQALNQVTECVAQQLRN